MTDRAAIVLLERPGWAPPGVPPDRWRRALASDVVDLLTLLDGVEIAIAATAEAVPLAEEIRWPGMPVFRVRRARPVPALAAAAASGFRQAAVLAPDIPDLPALMVAKLFRPLSTRAAAAAPVLPGPSGLVGLASRLPVPPWLAAHDPDLSRSGVEPLREAARASRPADAGDTLADYGVAAGPGWHRLRAPADLGLLDVALEGWEATRALLSPDR